MLTHEFKNTCISHILIFKCIINDIINSKEKQNAKVCLQMKNYFYILCIQAENNCEWSLILKLNPLNQVRQSKLLLVDVKILWDFFFSENLL